MLPACRYALDTSTRTSTQNSSYKYPYSYVRSLLMLISLPSLSYYNEPIHDSIRVPTLPPSVNSTSTRRRCQIAKLCDFSEATP
eukprot:scaffold266307_cov17-Prasinocladus_malaysianus.AAC.1